jgi:hypothetical protein
LTRRGRVGIEHTRLSNRRLPHRCDNLRIC